MKILLYLGIFLISLHLFSAPVKVPYTIIPHLDTAIYYHNIGVKEATNHNDGPIVEKFLRYVGLGKGYAWCAAFASYCIGQCDGIITKIKTALAQKFIVPSSISIKDVINGKKTVKPGWAIVFKHGSGPQGHVGLVYAWDGWKGLTVEGNAGDKVSYLERTYQPRNTLRISNFTPILYKKEIQDRIDKIKANWFYPTDNKSTNTNKTF